MFWVKCIDSIYLLILDYYYYFITFYQIVSFIPNARGSETNDFLVLLFVVIQKIKMILTLKEVLQRVRVMKEVLGSGL